MMHIMSYLYVSHYTIQVQVYDHYKLRMREAARSGVERKFFTCTAFLHVFVITTDIPIIM